MSLALGILFLSYMDARIYIFPVCRPVHWGFPLPVCSDNIYVIPIAMLRKVSPWNVVSISSRSCYIGVSGLEAAMLAFSLPVSSNSFCTILFNYCTSKM